MLKSLRKHAVLVSLSTLLAVVLLFMLKVSGMNYIWEVHFAKQMPLAILAAGITLSIGIIEAANIFKDN